MILSVQFMTMLAMVLGGFYLGIALDTFRRASPHWNNSVFLIYFIEIGFWLSQTLLLFYILYRVNAGELRLYVFVAVLLGFAAYQALAAAAYKKLLEHVIQFALSVYKSLAKLVNTLLITPVIFIFTLIFSAITYIVQVLLIVVLTISKILFAPIKLIIMLIYKLLPEPIKNYFYKIAGLYSTMKNISKKWWKYFTSKRR